MRVSLVSSDDGLRGLLGRLARAHAFVLLDDPAEAELLIWDFDPAAPPRWSAAAAGQVVLVDPRDAGQLADSGSPPGLRVVFKPVREADLEAAIRDRRAGCGEARAVERLRAERDALLQRLLGEKARVANDSKARLRPASAQPPQRQRVV